MATYNLKSLYNRITELLNDGYLFADISEMDADEEEGFPASLWFEAIEDKNCTVSYDEVESYKIPDSFFEGEPIHLTIKDTDCVPIGFNLQELSSLHHAVTNALEYFKECSSDKNCPRETLDEIKRASVACRNLQAKLVRVLNSYKN